MARHPGRFAMHATLPLPHAQESLDEIAWAFDEQGLHSVALNTFVGTDGSLADEALLPVWEELDRRGAIADHGLTWANGAPVEDATAVLQLLRADLPHRFASIRFHVAHLGGDLPFLAQRIQDNHDDWGSFEHSPAETLRTMWFDATNFFAPSP